MYIAIEGIKGSGKSTIINEWLPYTKSQSMDVGCFPITAPMTVWHPMECQYRYNLQLQNDDDFTEQLFINRAYWNQPTEKFATLIGDRSIVTAIVSRWQKWDDPYQTISKVKEDYKDIMKPDVIILIETPVENALINIASRTPKLTGKRDESRQQLQSAHEVYQELILDGLYSRQLGITDIIRLPYTPDIDSIQKEIFSIFKFYHQ